MGSEIEPVGGNEVELVSDGDGLAVIGESTAVERFMASSGLSKLDSRSLGAIYSAGASAAQAGAEVANHSGRWVKLTKESAQNLQTYGLTPTDNRNRPRCGLAPRGGGR